MHPALEDPWIAAQVEEAVTPFIGRLSDSEVVWMRDELAETLASDPRAAKLFGRTHPPTVDESGEVRRDVGGTVTPITDAKRSKKAG